ncbi:hypothetical protein BDC45DRAFT_325965 [Circinella umbellata]|nr:hypothetical protein BDC45DRAFT_325965 [Circinella umbellata]
MANDEQVVPAVQKGNDSKKHHKKKNKDRSNDKNKRKHHHNNDKDSLTKTIKKRKIRDIIGSERNNESATMTTNTTTHSNSTTNIETTPTPTSIPKSYQSASDSDSDSSDDDNNTNRSKTKTTTQKKKEEIEKHRKLTQNRILPKLHFVYDDGVDMKTQMKNRNMVYSTIRVNRDYYISDSDESSDSDDNYEGEPRCQWHRKVYHHPEKVREKVKKGEWDIKTGKFSVDELLRLEKRIKKIGRRDGLTLEQLRETVLATSYKEHLKFWYQITFPNRSLSQIVHHTKKCYHEDAYKGHWTPEQDKELLHLTKKYDRKFVTIAEKLSRTPKSCADRHRQLTHQPANRTHWSQEEINKLEKSVKEYTEKHGKSISWEYIAKEYFSNEKRNALQIRKKWESTHTTFNTAGAVIVRTMKDVTVQVQLMLFEQMQKMGWKSEDTVDYNKVNTDDFKISQNVARRTYYKMRDSLNGFEKMKYPEIIDRLVTTRRAMVESLG